MVFPSAPASSSSALVRHLHATPSSSSSSSSARQIAAATLTRHHFNSNNPAVLMLCHAEAGHLSQAQSIWTQLVHSSSLPGVAVVSRLLDAYAGQGHFDEIIRVVSELSHRDTNAGRHLYSLAVSCFGKSGELGLMEDAVKEMVSRGFKVDSCTGNAFVKYYAAFGSVAQMEAAYHRLKRTSVLIEKDAIRAMASKYINDKKFYKLGEFLKDVGLGRRNVGNLLWNLLLLSFAANFKMKSLQREFLNMLDAGFSPDLTTFNIRALAFSRMCMFWDLHLSIDHMRRDGVVPDLVTYGCFVDAYLERRLARNLSFAFDRMDRNGAPVVSTDALVFKAFGKGEFHASSEALLEAAWHKRWTYSKLLGAYLRKQYRKNQIFWNY